jgi:murein L,D-transpeptidase YafK
MNLRVAISASVAFAITIAFACGSHKASSVLKRTDRIVIVKSGHTMTLTNGREVLKVYSVALGRGPVGPKTRKGDHKTPEGVYIIDFKRPNSRFHRALHISYPNEADREQAQRFSLDPGGDVEIHGIENGLGWIGGLHRTLDWTDGCIAVTDSEIDEIWNSVEVGTPVEIKP